MKTHKFIILGIIIGILVVTLSVFVFVSNGENSEGRVGIINLWLEATIFLFLIIAAVITIPIIFRHKEDSWKPLFIFMLSGIILMILARVIIVLYDFRILKIGEETLAVSWHLIFYLGMISFLIVLDKVMTIKEKALGGQRVGFVRKDLIILVILGVLALAVLFSTGPLDSWFLSWFDGSFIAEIGLHHLLAFLFAGFIAAKFVWVKFFMQRESYDTRVIDALFGGLLIFLALTSLNHFWELITESWMIILLPETIIETVEQILWLPASIFLAYGLWRASKVTKSRITK